MYKVCELSYIQGKILGVAMVIFIHGLTKFEVWFSKLRAKSFGRKFEKEEEYCDMSS